jgi:bifunctional non-homologous end joining protein LigD
MPLPEFIEPQLATLVSAVPEGSSWLHELKFDGYRILCRIDNGRVSLLTRHAQDWTARFGVLADAAKRLPARQAILDGELVAFADDGSHDFQLLQNALTLGRPARLVYYAFDLLHLDGRTLRDRPLLERKKSLQHLLSSSAKTPDPGVIRYSEHSVAHGEELFAKACKAGLEGIISKRVDEPYRSGRSRAWLKIKCWKQQEFVILGFTDPTGGRVGFGALLLGVHDDHGALRYAGKVGTGFDNDTLIDLRSRLGKLERASAPLIGAAKGSGFRGVHWVEPKLVGEVVFTGWTADGLLRHPSFKGLREDKPASEIVREIAADPPQKNSQRSRQNESEIAGIELTHADRVLYPNQGITKRELALYYTQVAGWILPHLQARPLTILRCPNGYDKQCFYQRHPRDGEPVHSIPVREKGKTVRYLSVDSSAALIALVQLGALELHTWNSRAPRIEKPDRIIFDLDPGPEVPWEQIVEGAEHLRQRLGNFHLNAFVKTTGGKGLHVIVPLVPKQSWDVVQAFSRALAEKLASEDPQRYIATMSKAKRHGKIFIDYLRNNRTASAVSAYSTRARPGAPVSMPLRWDQLKKDPRAHFTLGEVPDYLARLKNDPWQGYEAARRPLTAKLIRDVRKA